MPRRLSLKLVRSRWRRGFTLPPLRLSIRLKVLGLIVVVVVAAVVTYLALAVSLFRQDKLAYVYDTNATLARSLAGEVEAGAGRLVAQLERLGHDWGRMAPRLSEKRRAGLWTTLASEMLRSENDVLAVDLWRPGPGDSYVKAFSRLDSARLSDASLSKEQLAAVQRTADLPWRTVLIEGVLLENVSLEPDAVVLCLAVALEDDGQIIVAWLNPSRIFRRFKNGETTTAFLVDREGRVLAHPDAGKVLARASMFDLPIVKEALEQVPRLGVRAFVPPHGEELIGAFARVESLQAAVITTVPTSVALAASGELVKKSVRFAVGVLMLGVLASIFFSRRVTAPLRELVRATRSLSTGDFSVRVAVHRFDEVGDLASAFNQMAAELLDRERRLAETHAQLLHSARLAVLGEMAAGISHEVKNPMAGMRGFAQLGLETQSLSEAHEYFELIEKETARAAAILDGLLRFSKKGKPALSRLSVNSVCADAIRLVHHQLQTQSIALESRLGDGVPDVLGNAEQLQQVLLNLILNAQHAMEGCPKRQLSIETRDATPGAVIVISDTGVGMTAEIMDNLFRAFHTTKRNGTGLGLSVSQSIVAEHGGSIAVDSAPGMGSTFRIYLPAAPARRIAGSAIGELHG